MNLKIYRVLYLSLWETNNITNEFMGNIGQRSLVGYSPWGHRVGHDWETDTLTIYILCSRRKLVEHRMGFLGGARGKEPTCQCGRPKRFRLSLGWEDPLEMGMATHSSILAWRISWTEEPGGLQSMGHKESDTTKRLGSSSSITFYLIFE